MQKAIFLLPLLVGVATPSLAQDSSGPLGDHAGQYYGSGEGELSAKLTHVDGDIYRVGLQTVTPISDQGGGCAGGIDGEMIMTKKGGNLFVENEDYDPELGDNPVNARVCEIGLHFVDGFLMLEERGGCMSYHGAACSFTGELIHENAIN